MNFELKQDGRLRDRRGPAAAAAAALLLAVLLVLAGPGGARAAGYDAETVNRSRDRVLADPAYQTELPEPEALPELRNFSIPPWLAKTLFWALIAVVAAVVLFFLFTLVMDLAGYSDAFRRKRRKPAAGLQRIETPLAARREADPGTLAEADRLAAEGRFSEAIHLLLLVAMERLHRELGPRVARAMTGREVLRLPALPAPTVEPLTRMVALSEINHFGGRDAAEPDYRNCRADFLRFNGEEPVTA